MVMDKFKVTDRTILLDVLKALEYEESYMDSSETNREKKQQRREAKAVLAEHTLRFYRPMRVAAEWFVTLAVAFIVFMVGLAIFALSPWVLLGLTITMLFIFAIILIVSGKKDDPPAWMLEITQRRLKRQLKKMERGRERALHKAERAREQGIESQLL